MLILSSNLIIFCLYSFYIVLINSNIALRAQKGKQGPDGSGAIYYLRADTIDTGTVPGIQGGSLLYPWGRSFIAGETEYLTNTAGGFYMSRNPYPSGPGFGNILILCIEDFGKVWRGEEGEREIKNCWVCF